MHTKKRQSNISYCSIQNSCALQHKILHMVGLTMHVCLDKKKSKIKLFNLMVNTTFSYKKNLFSFHVDDRVWMKSLYYNMKKNFWGRWLEIRIHIKIILVCIKWNFIRLFYAYKYMYCSHYPLIYTLFFNSPPVDTSNWIFKAPNKP
jgi:hypothetical protein